MTFTKKQEQAHREAFINEGRQKAWSAACHPDYVDKELERLQDELVRLQAQDDKLVADIEELANALDYHTVENAISARLYRRSAISLRK